MKKDIRGSNFRAKIEQLKGKRDQVIKSIKDSKERMLEAKKYNRKLERAREIIKQVGLKTQDQLSYNISEITTMALSAVMIDPYDLELAFVERRNKTECDIFFSRRGAEIEPFDGGGGPLDIAAFALRVASWSMQNPRSQNTLILDEPFKHLKGEAANKRMLEMVSEVSKKLGLQVIMVSDERVSREATIEATDMLFTTSIKKGVTKVNRE